MCLIPQPSPSTPLFCPQALVSQDGVTSARGPASSLGPRVFLPAPLAVGVVHSLPQEAGTEAAGKATGHCDAGRNATAETDPPLLPQ